MRLISFALTTEQIRNRTKTVTRRLGWKDLKPGTLLMACEKVMGRRGKPLVRLAVIVVTMVTREELSIISDVDVLKEGFDMPAYEFVEMFCREMGGDRWQKVTRIEFRYVPGGRYEL